MNLLFICSRNQWRSPTAEKVYQNDPRVEARSAGVSASARRRVSEDLLKWADVVLVMEHGHKRRLEELFPGLVGELRIEVLDIPDDYPFMDEELMRVIKERVEPLLG
ncbi:low molecular weight protein tyrosine phosphatase family protein [Prosthecobacter sp.]|uniref:low molecular weight protein tyrosine phosphatase family protein n=1 Tax=Prosthecobacter sp. TaxID=1965333 RepID=UPI003782EE64